MVVTIDFEQDTKKYRIERGRKPNFLRFIVDDNIVNSDNADEAQGENDRTQDEIERVLGMSHGLFCHLLALNTYTTPFLSLPVHKQREIIEELMSIMALSQKSDKLRELIKETKAEAEQEEFRIKTIKQSNDRIQNTITEFQNKIDTWDRNHANTIRDLQDAIANLNVLDIDGELLGHSDKEIIKTIKQDMASLSRDHITKTRHLGNATRQLTSAMNSYAAAIDQECPTCGQGITGHDHERVVKELEATIAELDGQINQETKEIAHIESNLESLKTAMAAINEPKTFYPTHTEALNHKNTIEQLQRDLDRELQTENPFSGQADVLSNTIQEVTYTKLNELVKEREHQEFLFKLLTNKDSFIRKKIIDQNLTYLNTRLSDYLHKLGLPHRAIFLNDLSAEISLLGQELDFDSLSRGERTRLILGLSFAFRDIFESTKHSINLLFIDELLDAGIDPAGMESAVEILKRMERERKKNIFVISHREDLQARVESVLTVVKENNFSRFEWDYAGNA